MAREKFTTDFKRNFLTGLAALFPLLITIFLLSWLYGHIDRTIGQKVHEFCVGIVAGNEGVFERLFPNAAGEVVSDPGQRVRHAQEEFPHFVGVSVALLGAALFVYILGMFLRGYFGSRIMRGVDSFFERFPVVKAIYPHARRVAGLLFGQDRREFFNQVVAVQYPRRGLYTVGFLTGKGLKGVEERAGQRLVTVFIPTSPAPLTGFIIIVPPEEVIELDMGIDEAFRFSLTAGMLAPDKQRPQLTSDREPGREAGTSPSLLREMKRPRQPG